MSIAVPDDQDRLDVELGSPEQQSWEEGSSTQNHGSTSQPDVDADHALYPSGVCDIDNGSKTPPRDSAAGYTGSFLRTSQDDLEQPGRSDARSFDHPNFVSSERSTADRFQAT